MRAGYRMLGRNVRSRAGELDLIATDGRCVVFCEVRSRIGTRRTEPHGPGGPLESIGPAKRRRLRRLAREWLAAQAEASAGGGGGADGGCGLTGAGALRFDAIGVVLRPDGTLMALEHVEDAF